MAETGQLIAILNALRNGQDVAGRMMCESGDEAIRPADFFFFKQRGGQKERITIPNYVRAYGAEGLLEVVRTLVKSRPTTIEYIAAIFAEVADSYMNSTITPEMPEYEALNQEWNAKKRPNSFIASTGNEFTVIMASGKALFVDKGSHSGQSQLGKYASTTYKVPEKPKVAQDASPAPRRRAKSKVEDVPNGEESPVSPD